MASGIVVALVLSQLLPLVQTSCVTSLEDLETVLQSDPLNVESINDAFFPLNKPPSIAANVFYFINETINGTATVPVHPATMNTTTIERLVPSYAFQWVSQRVLLPFGPELLEMRGLAVFAPNTPMTLLVIQPICITRKDSTDYGVQIGKILARLTSKLQWFARSPGNHKRTGYVAVLLANGTRGLFDGDTFDRTGDLLSLPLLGTIMIYQYSASFGLSMLLPLIFIKLGIPLPSRRNISLSQTKRNCFWGTVFTVIPSTLWLLSKDVSLYSKISSSFWAKLWLPIPVALPVLFVVDSLLMLVMVHSRYKLRYGVCTRNGNCLNLFIRGFGCIAITLFCQVLVFHIGWLFPLLIAFPMKVGTLVVMNICYLLNMILIFSGFVHFVTAPGITKIMHHEYSGLGLLSLSGLCLTSIYYYTQGSIDDGSRDGIATMMVNLFPILVFGVLTWIYRSYTTAEEGHSEECAEFIQEVKKSQDRTNMSRFYHKQLNDLPV